MTEKSDVEVSEKCSDLPTLPSITDMEKEMAQNTFQEFEKGNYKSCMEQLNQLLASRTYDPKVLHNKSVADFYSSQFMNVEEFRKSLAQVCSQAHMNLEDCDNLDDVDHCVIYYNQAVLLYHMRQYHAAITILDKVFQFIEPLEETLARKVCFLLLELYLCTFQTEKAMGLVGYIETLLFGSNNNENKSQSPEKDKDKNGKETSSNKEATDPASNEIYRAKLQQYKGRLYVMLRSMKACKREIKGLMNSVGLTTFTVYLKSNLEYLRGNYRKALKVLNTAPHPTAENGENISTMYYNNVGCIHFYMGKPHLGCFYFRQALKENEKAVQALIKMKDDTSVKVPLPLMGTSRHYELLFNLGIQLLHARMPLPAFDCLMETIQVYPTNARLWLRLAECCIVVHKPDNFSDFNLSERQKDLVQGIVGAGPHRKIIVSSGLSTNILSSETQSAAMPNPTLEFASLCLKNALLLLHEDSQAHSTLPNPPGSEDGDTGSVSVESSQCVIGLPGNSIRSSEVLNLRTSVLAASAYVALCLGDNVMALHYAESLLSQPKICGVHKLLGHLYAGEALVLLDRISDAVQQFNPDQIKDLALTLPSNDKEEKIQTEAQETTNLQGWYPNSATTGRVVMQYNLAVAYALRGEYEKAGEVLRQLSAVRSEGVDVPVQAVMLAMYVQLQQGNADVTRNIIKQHIPQFR